MQNIRLREQGAVLLVILFILSLGFTVYLLKAADPDKLKRARAQKTMQSLGEAKAALMAWAVNNSINLGQLPFPDRARGGGYDGFSDCLPSGTTFRDPESYQFLIGKLPVYGQTSPCVGQQIGLGLDNNVHLENRLWYAVSRNVVHQYEYLSDDPRSDPMINPSLIHHPAYPWLRVLDRNGELIADRVAAVIIAPGENISTQNRAEGAAPDQFLDAFYKDGQPYANHDYDSADEDFVMGDDATTIDAQDKGFEQPYLFNDQLVYITIDELIQAINKRVLAESKWLLHAYAAKKGVYPNAADLAFSTLQSNIYRSGAQLTGLLPFDVTDDCHCTSAEQCDCAFGVTESVTMYRQSGTWNSLEDTGACVSTLKASAKECTCNGAGSCNRTYSSYKTSFRCDATGLCQSEGLTVSERNQFSYRFPSFADIDAASNHCQLNRDAVVCNGEGDFQIGLNEAVWMKQNGWPQYLYYAWSPNHQLQAGTRQGIAALVIATGAPISAETGINQIRPSANIGDYLDSTENTDGDEVYEPSLRKVSTHYNDELIVVSP